MDVIDTHYLGVDQSIGCFLIETSEGALLVESGPNPTLKNLRGALRDRGLQAGAVRHVFLTHIHLDHAGSAWEFAKEGATVYVHPFGYPHLNDPAKLLESASRVYGPDMEKMWGHLEPIPEARLRAVEDKETITIGGVSLTAHYTPGHANHHICWQWGDALFAGDVAGIRIKGGPAVPPCPPPDISVERWLASFQTIRTLNPSALYLTHYGVVEDVDQHLTELEERLHRYAAWVKERLDEGEEKAEMLAPFVRYVEEEYKKVGVSREDLVRYHTATPPALAVSGLIRYWRKKAQNAL